MVADVSRAVAAELVASGAVLVDGTAVTVGRTPLVEGSVPDGALPLPGDAPTCGPEPGVRFTVVHADDQVVVVDKPAGLVVHPGAGHDQADPGRGAPGPLPRPGRPGRGRGVRARPAGHRAPAGQGHLGPPGRGPHGRGLRAPGGPAGGPHHGQDVPGPGRGATWPRTGARSRRRSAARRGPRPRWPCVPAGSRRARRTGCSSAGRTPRPATLLEVTLDRSHPPDPGAPGRHRPSGGGRRPLRDGRPAPGRGTLLPPRRPLGVRAPGHRRCRLAFSPRCPRTWRRYLGGPASFS